MSHEILEGNDVTSKRSLAHLCNTVGAFVVSSKKCGRKELKRGRGDRNMFY